MNKVASITTLLFALTTAFSCGPCDDEITLDKTSAKSRIAFLCGTSSTDASMDWVDNFLAQADSQNLRGNIYAFKYSGGVAIIHRADIMSCLPCNVHDCSGAEIQITSENSQELIDGMKTNHLIYSTTTL